MTSRFILVERATLAPARDYITWTTESKRGFIDTNRNIPFQKDMTGRVYLSVDTVEEMAKVARLFDKPGVAQAKAHQEGYEEGYADGLADNLNVAELRAAVASLVHLVSFLPNQELAEEGQGTDGADDGSDTGPVEGAGQSDSSPFD